MQAISFYTDNIRPCPYGASFFFLLIIKINQNEPNAHKQMANIKGVNPQTGADRLSRLTSILVTPQCYGSVFKL